MDLRERIVHGDEHLPIELYDIHPDYVRYRMAVHWHPEHELLWVRRGRIRVHLDDETYALSSGDVLFIQGGAIHSAEPEDCDYVCILLNLSLLMKRSDACAPFAARLSSGDVKISRHLGGADSTYAALCRQMLDAHRAGGDAYPFLMKGLIFSLFGQLLRDGCYTESSTDTPTLSRRISRLKGAIAYMEEHYAAPLRLEELASLADMTPNHFCRTFKKYIGKTPISYLTEYRLGKAQYALRTTELSVTEIAMEAGFGDVSHFIRTFREAYGMTPKMYRRTDHPDF